MKLRTEICNVDETEIVIRCNQRDQSVKRLEAALASILPQSNEMILTLNDTEYFVPKKSILFFETDDGKVTAHTAKAMYYTSYKLYELEEMMSVTFVRVSKSCIVNIDQVSALKHNQIGASEVFFKSCDKKVYASRGYYKALKDMIYEMRINR
ncbi:MAG: LytTR family transcriptional regulator DNA-binding domain-containing protein [Clostridia bacterium]|nr:LytTR family transcriptional regulator DNA-binding domain-containing protein [Clostridia bacterium]